MTSFQTFVNITVTHEYFHTQKCRSLVFHPSDETKKVMKRYDMMFLPKEDGFKLVGSAKIDVNYIADITGVSTFTFYMVNTDAHFVAFTNLPMDWKGKICFQPEGGQLQQTLSYVSANQEGVIGELTLPFSAMGSYTMHFTARSTGLKYFIVNQSNLDIDDALITDNQGMTFAVSTSVTLPNGQEATLFSSGDHEFPLKKNPTTHFSLKAGKKVIFKSLPTPYPGSLEMENNAGVIKVYSPIYVYI